MGDPETETSLVRIGRVAGAFGVRGEVRIRAYGDDPLALVRYGVMRTADGAPLLTLLSGRAANGHVIAVTRELADKEAADGLRGVELFVERAVLPTPEEDEYYLVDLIGLRAESPEGAFLGRVAAVQNFGAGDLLDIEGEAGASRYFLPFTREVVLEVRLSEGRLIARPPTVAEDAPAP